MIAADIRAALDTLSTQHREHIVAALADAGDELEPRLALLEREYVVAHAVLTAAAAVTDDDARAAIAAQVMRSYDNALAPPSP